MTIQEILDDNPEFANYELCLGQFLTIDADEDITAIADYPILAIAADEETKEIRFFIEWEGPKSLQRTKQRIIHIVDQKLAEHRDEQEETEDE